MKNKNLLLLSLVALSLVGCTKNSNSVSHINSEAPVSNTSQKASTKGSTTGKDTASTKTSTSTKDSDSTVSTKPSPVKSDTGTISTAPSTDKDSDTGTTIVPPSTGDTSDSDISSDSGSTSQEEDMDAIYASTKWKKAVVDLMYKHLGKNILPYVELGTTIVPSVKQGVTTTLTLTGNIISPTDLAARVATAKTTYENAGYTVTATDESMTATLESKNLSVVFKEDSEILVLIATYTEPFDPSTSSAYPDDIIQDLNDNFGNHAADIPFVYLGTANPTGSLSKTTYTITGGKWDDQIITLAQNAFNAANSSIQKEENKWVITMGTNSYGQTFKADILLSDLTKFHVEILTPSTSSTNRIAKMTIKYTEPFVPPTNGDWPSQIKTYFQDNMGGHTIPYFYMGTMAPTSSWIPNSLTLTILGGEYNSQIIDLAKAAFDKENQNIADNAYKWVYTFEDDILTISKLFEDGCEFHFTLKENSSHVCYLQGQYVQGYVVPAGADWASTTKTAFNDHLDGNAIPYVYLNTTAEKTSWTENTGTLSITGGKWFEKVLPGALAAFQAADGWTATLDQTSKAEKVVAEKILDNEADKKIVVTICGTTSNTTSGNSGSCKMSITYYKYEVPTAADQLAWTSTIDTKLKTVLLNHTLPFVYLNSNSVQVSGSNGKATLTGGLYNKQVLANATQAFAGKGTPTIEDEVFTLSYTETDGCTISVTIKKNSSSRIQLDAVIYEKYQTGKASDWTDNVKNTMKKTMSNYVLPFIDLGVDTPFTGTVTSSKNVYLMTTTWDDSILTNAKTTLEGLGWKTFQQTNMFVAYIRYADGSGCFMKIIKQVYGDSFRCYLDAFYVPKATKAYTKAAWSDTELAFLNKETGNHADKIPFICLGDGDYKTTDATATALGNITGTVSDGVVSLSALETLIASGYTIEFSTINQKPYFEATYEDESGYVITLNFKTSSSKQCMEIKYGEVFKAPTEENAKYTDDVKTKTTAFIGDGIELPFVYLGAKEPEITEKTSEIDLVGTMWDDSIYDLAAKAFEAKKADGWTYMRNYYDDNFQATLVTPSGKKIKVVISKDSNERPVMKITKK